MLPGFVSLLIPDGFAVAVINMVAFRFQKYRTFDSNFKFDFAPLIIMFFHDEGW